MSSLNVHYGDRAIAVDGDGRVVDADLWVAVPADAVALQWDGSNAVVQYRVVDGHMVKPPGPLTDDGHIAALLVAHAAQRDREERAHQIAVDALKAQVARTEAENRAKAKAEADAFKRVSDWTVEPDVPLTAREKLAAAGLTVDELKALLAS